MNADLVVLALLAAIFAVPLAAILTRRRRPPTEAPPHPQPIARRDAALTRPCTACGARASTLDATCPACGARLPSRHLLCPKCGLMAGATGRFCKRCRTPLTPDPLTPSP